MAQWLARAQRVLDACKANLDVCDRNAEAPTSASSIANDLCDVLTEVPGGSSEAAKLAHLRQALA
jgi:hypothetical protein